MSARYYVAASGCDGMTRVLIDLDDAEVAAIEKVRDAINAASSYGCMPTIEVRPASPYDEDDGAVAS